MNSSPLVSIVALCYNHEQFLVETLDSIINQSYRNIELMIIDNASSDNSKEKINEWIHNHHDKNVRVVFNEQNVGICPALNYAIKHFKGKYFQMISCDDVMVSDKIEKQVKVFESSSDSLAFVYGNYRFIDANSEFINKANFYQNSGWNTDDDFPSGRIFELLFINYFLRAPTVLYKLDCIKNIGGYDETIPFEDYQMNLRLSEKFACKGMADVLCNYRILENSYYSSSTNDLISKNFFKTMSHFYGKNHMFDWVIQLKFLNFNRASLFFPLRKTIFGLLNYISKEYKKFLK
ncbi:glycosyltransferase family 2 protein [Mongoliitalea lutea]|uniref:Glycosyltransferase 2-like domain-containing protein n=1 Tax=Mongoliitalea lutea TaxID=849756 RepID=A0A8J3G4I5_9BACT|nr:glycosyltransferase [Mongoliitalea lutea]GHB31428.1 hypothetical protein GCM10008106_10230 [Mongoliitalea lutea]